MPARNISVISRGKPPAPHNPEGVRRVEEALARKKKKSFFSRSNVQKVSKVEKRPGLFAQLLGAFRGRKF